jgi:hypothetical protein
MFNDMYFVIYKSNIRTNIVKGSEGSTLLKMKPAIWQELEPATLMSIPQNMSPIHDKVNLVFCIFDADVSQNVSLRNSVCIYFNPSYLHAQTITALKNKLSRQYCVISIYEPRNDLFCNISKCSLHPFYVQIHAFSCTLGWA